MQKDKQRQKSCSGTVFSFLKTLNQYTQIREQQNESSGILTWFFARFAKVDFS